MKNSKLFVGLGLAAMIIVVAVAAGFLIGDTTKVVDYTKEMKVESADLTSYLSDSSEELATYYKSDMSAYYDGANTGSMYYIFANDGTFTMLYGCQSVLTGTYKQEGNEVILYQESSDSSSTEDSTEDSTETTGNEVSRYLFTDNMLLSEKSICTGEVPDTDTFDVTCTMKSSDTSVYYYGFQSDGTYTLTNYVQTEDKDTDDKMYSGEGTYTRDGDKINITINDTAAAPYLIWDNHLVTSYYEQIDDEQFTEEYAANYAAAQEAASTDSTETTEE